MSYDGKVGEGPRTTTRIYQPKDAILFKCPPANCGVNNAQYARFQIPTPSSRMLVKIALFWWPSVTGQANGALLSPPDNPIDIFQQLSMLNFRLNLYTAEQAETGWLIPTGDILGTLVGLAGQQIPLASAGNNLGQAGFSIDIQGGQDWICGLFLLSNCTGYAIPTLTGFNISLRVRYEVQGSEMCQDEWDRLVSKLQVQATPTVVFT